MLLELFVKNFATIEEIRLQFGPGFSVISGETGAGKSILVGALGLLLGGKATPTLIRSGADEAFVEGVFDVGANPRLLKMLDEAGLEEGSQVIIRRHLSSEGRNKIYVNGRVVPLSQLETLAPYLIDLSGQHDQQILLHEENHRAILDGDPQVAALVEQYHSSYKSYSVLSEELATLKQAEASRESRLDFLRFQVQEIQNAKIDDVQEEEKLLAEKSRVKHAEYLFNLARELTDEIEEKEGALRERLDIAIEKTTKALSRDESLKEGLNLLTEARAPLSEAGRYFSSYLENLSVEPDRLNQIESRLHLFHQLKKKHGDSLQAVCNAGDQLAAELNTLENLDDVSQKKEKELSILSVQLLKKGAELSEMRKKLALDLQKKIQKELSELSMPRVVFRINVLAPSNPQSSDCLRHGFDTVSFDLAANPGETPRPLSKIASGGELSRILLAIKQVLRVRAPSITYIFDEVDTGIGGAQAFVVGQKLNAISTKNQVICVTHLPQVAAHAGHHYVIEKGVRGGRTFTEARILEAAKREEELARMMGGVDVTVKAREHAREMLRLASG